jgi:hypothetical protein
MKFTAASVSTFMGGEFDLERPPTVHHLIAALQGVIKELEGWGDDSLAIGEVSFEHDRINVTLAEGIPE